MSIENIFSITLVLATLFCTMVTGFLFGFAVVAMPGIKGLTDREFIRAFQGMDGIIQNNNPFFILIWAGSVLVLLIAAALGFGQLDRGEIVILMLATLIYLFGVQLPTGVVNVPLNNELQTVNVDAVDETTLNDARNNFEPRWNQWNLIRTVFATLASGMLMVLLYIL